LAADHRARGMITVERYDRYLGALLAASPHCEGLMASAQPLRDLVRAGAAKGKETYLSLNRTGLAGSAFELDDRLVASVESAAAAGYTGVKVMTRVDLSDPLTAPALELLGQVLERSFAAGLEAMVEPLSWKDGSLDRSADGIVLAAVIAHDMGAPLLKVPVPEAPAGEARVEAVARVTGSVGVPVLVLGGPRGASRSRLLDEIADGMAGGAAGAVIGRAVYQDPDPGGMAKLVADLVKRRAPLERLRRRAESLGG
jgi:DhnA family fructose-bisphosphate aldolase class Ia